MMEWIVTSSAMILIVIALRGLLKGKISLKLQYGLWALVLIRLLLPFTIVDSSISITNVLSAPVIREADDAVTDYETAYQGALQQYEASGTEYTDTEIRQLVQQELYDRTYAKLEQEYTQTGAAVPQVQIQAEAQQQVEVISLTAVITEALPYLWIAGMIVVAVALIGSNLHFGWKLYQSRTPLDIPGFPLEVYLTDYVATPCLFGFGRPDVYLTNEVMTDSKMRGHVLAHELSHYHQGDHIWSMLRCVCLVLHWYNPLVWAAAILSKQDAELACDEATIKVLGEDERVAYGRTLVGMTCVRRDPSSLMLTATTMLGTKKTLKERVALIAKKPKTALYTLIACVLVVSLAVGCTFTGAPTAPTEPTGPDDAVWEQLNEAVDAVNSAESCHFSFYLIPENPGEVDLESLSPANEGWVYGDNFYLGHTEPSQLYYDGTFYVRRSDDTWLVDRYPDDDEYGIDAPLPARSTYTMTWTQTEEYLDVVLRSDDDENERLLYRMDADGKLLWYADTFPGSVIDADGVQTQADLYTVYVFHDTAPADVREKVETSAAQILDTMVEWDGKPNTEPTTEPTETPTELSEDEILLEQCREAVEYIQNLDHFEITERRRSNSYDLLLTWDEAYYLHTGLNWFHSRKSADSELQNLRADGSQYVRNITSAMPQEDVAYPEWTEVGLFDGPPGSNHCWLLQFEWDPDRITFRGATTTPQYKIISLDYESDEEYIDSCVLSFWIDSQTNELASARKTTTEQFDLEPVTVTSELWISAGDPVELAAAIAYYRLEAEIAESESLIDLELPKEPTGPNTTNIDLDLAGMVLDANGNVKKNVSVTIQGTRTDNADGYDEMELDIAFSDNYRYVIGHLLTVSYSSDSQYILLDYDVCMGYGYDGVAETSRAVMFAMSIDREYLILEWEGVDGEYLVASADPDTTPEEIMEYFREYLEKFSYSRPQNESTAETTALPYNTWTTVSAVLVNDQGEVLETMELTVKAMIWEQEGRENYNLSFLYPDNVSNSGTGVMPYPEDENAYTCSAGISTEGAEGTSRGAYYVGFDAEKGCFIVDFDDGEDVYLIAHWGPDEDISALWDHFQDFITMRPENFPNVW